MIGRFRNQLTLINRLVFLVSELSLDNRPVLRVSELSLDNRPELRVTELSREARPESRFSEFSQDEERSLTSEDRKTWSREEVREDAGLLAEDRVALRPLKS